MSKWYVLSSTKNKLRVFHSVLQLTQLPPTFNQYRSKASEGDAISTLFHHTDNPRFLRMSTTWASQQKSLDSHLTCMITRRQRKTDHIRMDILLFACRQLVLFYSLLPIWIIWHNQMYLTGATCAQLREPEHPFDNDGSRIISIYRVGNDLLGGIQSSSHVWKSLCR